jgi:hypothetical protein
MLREPVGTAGTRGRRKNEIRSKAESISILHSHVTNDQTRWLSGYKLKER